MEAFWNTPRAKHNNLLVMGPFVQGPGYSKCGPWTSSLSISRELIRNA